MKAMLKDSMTMLRRQIKHLQRYPSLSLMMILLPVMLLLLFVYVFGGTMGAGLGVAAAGRKAYVAYVTPGIILIAIAGVAQSTPIAVSMDMADGIIARFRTMGISRGAVLAGHVLANTIQTLVGVALVIGVAIAIGFRPNADPVEWLAAFGLIAFAIFAITWLSAALGLRAKSVETASNLGMPLLLLVFIGSGFVPTDSMAPGLAQFAKYQPFTPVTETIRGLLMGTPVGNDAVIALVWCAIIGFLGYRWALRQYDRDPTREVRLLSVGSA
jgi:ABC-2 type transport system permease protein